MATESGNGQRTEIHVVVLTDRAYLPWCATTITSAMLASPGAHIVAHVLCAGDVDVGERNTLRAMAGALSGEVVCAQIDEATLDAFPSKGPAFGDRISWARVNLGEALHDLSKVVYLDADTLVVGSLEDLWRLPLHDAPVAAVANVTEISMRPHLEHLGFGAPSEYFNAGVMVADLAQWRTDRVGEALSRFVNGHAAPLPWFDQDALNVVFVGRWHALHPRWNAMNSLWTWEDLAFEVLGASDVRKARSDPAVLHFEGPNFCKPWHQMSDHPWRQRYRDAFALTPWAGRGLEDRTVATRLIPLLPASQQFDAYFRLLRTRRRADRVRRGVHRLLPTRVVKRSQPRQESSRR